ncbi:MAG: putative monovalent cation/H+ antiporter subunit A [Anaerolineae bacterium]|nr:putative monovalent cation/H+ antiporter subunit A [Anaerolineae bacterium]
MFHTVLTGFRSIIAEPWQRRVSPSAMGWFLGLLPLSLVIYFVGLIPPISHGEVLAASLPWVPSLGINLSFYIDGLSLLFALIISGIGTLIVIYGGGYLAHDHQINRFYLYVLLFMGAMLGVVLANNILTLFVFWELTSITSFLLIGYYHEKPESRASALQALLVTGAGGLAMLAGLLLLGQVGGSWELSELFGRGELVRSHAWYAPLLILVLLGAFTKSAQFPFHFWLPGAMAAPTPVSAYLHSATMVKLGIYLVARLSPVLGGTTLWLYLVSGFGAFTMLLAAYIAWQQTDLKRILAYSTVSALGTLMMLLGFGSHVAVEAAMVFLVVHSLYKGALFMVAGAIDHEAGTRDIRQLGGLRAAMPFTATAAVLAALSMSGLPPFFGFVGKELIYEATLESYWLTYLLVGAAVLTNALNIVAAGLVTLRPFFGAKRETPKHAHEAPLSMWLGPVTLAGLGLLVGLFAPAAGHWLIGPAVSGVLAESAHIKLALWHGLNPTLLLSLVTIAVGVAIYWGRSPLAEVARPLNGLAQWGPEQWYRWSLAGMLATARWQTRLLQSGYLRNYLLWVILTTVGLTGYTLFSRAGTNLTHIWRTPDVTFYELMLYLAIMVAAVVVVRSASRLAAVAALGVVGYGVALIFILFGAPDLAMTQFSIETLSVILLVLVLYKLPPFVSYSTKSQRLRDLLVAGTGGILMTLMILVVTALPAQSRLTPYFAENSLLLAKGHNVVNVILVDFRGFDTMGEITVLGMAAIGVYGLLKLRLDRDN